MHSLLDTPNQRSLVEKYTQTGTLLFDYDTGQVSVSNNLLNLLGLERNDSQIPAEWDLPCFSEHTQKLLKNRISLGESNLSPIELRVVFKTSQGKDRWLRYCCEFIGEANKLSKRVALFQDITHTVELAEKNNYYQERVELALLNSNTGTWDYRVDSNELYWDESMYNLFDARQAQKTIKFHDWVNLIHVDHRDTFMDQINTGMKKGDTDDVLDIVFQTVTPLGNIKYIKLKARSFYNDFQKVVRIIGTCNDVTETQLQNDKLLEQATIAQKNAMLLQEANAARGRFIANVSHEVRTPMNAVLGAIQILQSYDFNDELRSIIDMASQSSYELLQILNDVLDLSKLDARKLDIEQVDLNVKELLENAISKHSQEIRPSVELTVDIPIEFANNRLGDPLRFNQIINNLISNAVKFTLNGNITITASGDHQFFQLTVKDTGVGISEDDQSHIFEPFRQVDETTTREFGGAGLGLAISNKLVSLMGGEIALESTVGIGSEFSVTLPLPVIKDNVMNEGVSTLTQAVPDLSKHTILFAEDKPQSSKIVQQLLRPTGAKVITEIDGKRAIESYRKLKSFTAVIVDEDLPVINALNLCEKIRRENKYIPIIAICNQVKLEDQKMYFNAGFTHVVERPIKFDSFYQILMQL